LKPTTKACPARKGLPTAPASASAAPASASASAAQKGDTLLKVCEDLIAKHPEDSVIRVIQQVLAVFRPGQSFIKTVVEFGTLAELLKI
jgi:hypothetical protein